jgi:uncharacterized protein YukE
MPSFEGMNVEAVESLAQQLKVRAQGVLAISGRIDSVVQQLNEVWQGPEATDFQGWWFHQYRPALHAAAEAVTGLGQSALNNAQQQIVASGAGSQLSIVGAVGAAAVGSAAAVGAFRPSATSAPGSTASPSTQGSTGAGAAASGSAVVETATGAIGLDGGNYRPEYREYAPGASPTEWCGGFVTWALHKNGIVNGTNFHVQNPAWVPSWIDAAKTPGSGITEVARPQPGDLVVYYYGNEASHIGIVTQGVTSAGQFRAVSGNFDGKVAMTNPGDPYSNIRGGSNGYASIDKVVFLQVNGDG